jgi:nanoRNase/pAp phosphatase (c-di-AMP/oligoRNAs hydrolase)
MGGEFKTLLSVIDKKRRLFLQMHRPPDPDCIASAAILSDMLVSVGLSPVIVYSGTIGKQGTLELIDAMGIRLTRLDTDANKNLVKENDQIIVVDCQKENSNVAHLPGEYIACIDHHPELVDKDYLFEDIRPEYGACASIVYEYAAGFGYALNPRQAALLLYAIRMDTDDLQRKYYGKDIDIFCELYKTADLAMLTDIGRHSIRPEDISTTITAYRNLTIKKNLGFSFAGEDKARESLAELADRLVSLADVDFVVVYGKSFNGYCFSIRSQLDYLHAGEIARAAFAKVDGDGGGHRAMAGGIIPKVAFMDWPDEKSVMVRLIGLIEDTVRELGGKTFAASQV